MRKPLTSEIFIARSKEAHGDRYDYSKSVYTKKTVKITITCKDHGDFLQFPADHTKGVGCPECGRSSRGDSRRTTVDDFIKKARATHGDRYDYSEVKIKNVDTPVDIICTVHGTFKQRPYAHVTGQGCPTCALESSGDSLRLPLENWLERFVGKHGSKYGYSDVEEIRSKDTLVSIQCPTHGTFQQRASDHAKGRGCDKCGGSATLLPSELLARCKATHGDRYEYDEASFTGGSDSIVRIKCVSHGWFQQVVRTHFNGSGCPTCPTTVSKAEREITALLDTWGITHNTQVRLEGSTKSVDIVIPSLGLAIEYNGVYWHSSINKTNYKTIHKEKSGLCATMGLRLIHIWSDDWTYRKEATVQMLGAQLGLLPKIHARKCSISVVPTEEARAFVNANHLQGYTSGIYYGLYTDGKLVSAMGFSQATSVRGNTDPGLIELVRYASTASVIGGAKRLLTAYLRSAHGGHTMVTYCFPSSFSGDMYRRLGFTDCGTSSPDYWVIFPKDSYMIRKHKSHTRKDRLERYAELHGFTYDGDKTEEVLSKEYGIGRVYDCGRTKFSMTL